MLPGVLTAEQVADTAASIAGMQEPSGAIPWTPGEHTDVWNHLESAMALHAAGLSSASLRAYDWTLELQRADGSWPLKIVEGVVEDASGDTNMSAYLAVAVWRYWLQSRDLAVVRRYWPAVCRGLDFVCSLQLPFGGIAWSQEWAGGLPGRVNEEALVAGSSSIYQALRSGLALASLLDAPASTWSHWADAGARLGHALTVHRDRFLDKRTFSMDWYYPVLGGAVRGRAGRELLAGRWDDFVVPSLGVRCVDTNPWVTGAETCELALALDALGDRERARRLVTDMQHLRAESGAYWTGYVYSDGVNWPVEHTTYTAAAVILAADALGAGTAASGLFRGDGLPGLPGVVPDCGCASADEVAGLAPHPA